MNAVQLLRNQWDRSLAVAATAGGALALLLGYLGVSGTSYTQEQLPYLISGGIFGVFLLGVAGILWLTADLRDEWRKLDDLDSHLQELIARDDASGSEPAEPVGSVRPLGGRGPQPAPGRARRSRSSEPT